MKTKRIGISIITLILSLICGLGFVSLPKKQVNVSAADAVTYNQYMLDGEVPSQKSLSTSAGSLFINGQVVDSQTDLSYKFVLTQKNIALEARTNLGFELKGWYIAYADKADVVEGTTNGYISITDAEQNICSNNIVVDEYSLVNKNAAITILQMTDDLVIAPVFDYQYYKVTLKGVNFEKEIDNPGFDGFKFGDTVTISETIDNDDVNIDAISMTSTKIDLVENLDAVEGVGEYTLTKDAATGRTTAYSAKFTMSVYEDVEVELVYDNLHKVNLKLFLEDDDHELTSGEKFNQILSCVSLTKDTIKDGSGNDVQVDRFFKKLTDTSYFVKNGANFEISVANNYKYNGYTYYNFESLDGSTSNKTLNLNNISSDRDVKVKYVHNTFKVEFVGVEYNSTNKTVRVNNDIETVDDVVVTRVSPLVNLDNSLLATGETWANKNVGYTFVGFAKYVAGKVEYDVDPNFNSYTLDTVSPEDAVIYVLYTRTAYTISLKGLEDINLTNKEGVKVYPVAAAKIGTVEKTGTTMDFAGYYIGDSITLELKLNAGFNVSAIKYGTEENEKLTKDAESQVYTLVLDKAFLTGKDTTINLTVVAETLKYTLTYKISKHTDSSAMADIWVDGYSLSETLVDGYFQIVVPDLTYYQTLNLKCKANSTGSTGEYFVFRWFTTDFKTTLTEGLTNDSAAQTTCTLPFVMYGDSVVYVVYSQPKTQLRIDVVSAPVDAGISFDVKQSASSITAVDGLYEIIKGSENQVSITISGLKDNKKLFGYKYINTKLYILDAKNNLSLVTGSEQTSMESYSFVPTTTEVDALYVVVVNIETIKYQFKISDKDGGFTWNKDLTVEDSVIEFTKQVGYYVSKVEFREKTSYGTGVTATYEEYAKMNQTNVSRSGLEVDGKDYFYVFFYEFNTSVETGKTKSEFEEIIETYGYVEGANVTIELIATFEIYKYDVNLKYVKFYNNALDGSTGNKLVYPQVQLTYKLTADGESVVASYENLSSEVKFVGIPYGADITLNIVRGVSVGFDMKGWYDYETTYKLTSDVVIPENQKLYTICKNDIVNDLKLSYRVDFNEYEVILNYESGTSNPLINNASTAVVKMGDKIEILPNASLDKGYMFYQFKYKTAEYEEYVFVDAATFATDAENLYILDGGYVFKNISTTYNEKLSYCVLKETITTNDSASFVDNSFDIGNYVLTDGVVEFVLEFIPVEMTIDNISKAIERLDGNGNKILDALDLVKVGLTAEDLAIYTITATSGGVTRPIIENESIVTINDVITINIQINKAAQSTNSGANIYDLSKGLTLYSYPLTNNWNNLTFKNLGGGAYQISFVVAQNIKSEFAKEGKISIEYGYRLNDPRTVSVTTNIAGSSAFNEAVTLKITGATTSVSGAESSGTITQQNPFLQNVKVELLLNGMDENFVINSITAYKGEMLADNVISNLSSYFIKSNQKTLTGTDRVVIESVDLIMLDADITIQFNVQPRIYIEGEEITTQTEKVITRTYKYMIDGNNLLGVAQDIVLGSDIKGFGISDAIMQVVAYKDGVKLTNGAIDVGEYTLKLEFKTGINEADKTNCWLYYIKDLPCVLKLNIEQQNVKITFDKAETKPFEREYMPSTNYDLGLVRKGKKLTTGDGNIVIVGVVNSTPFDLGFFDLTGGKAEVVSYGKSGELVSQNSVTGDEVHIFISGLTLVNNKNFKFEYVEYDYYVGKDPQTGENLTEKRSGLLVTDVVKIVPKKVSIKFLEVYNKVYDGNEVAKFGLTEGATEYVLEYIYLDDKVYLLPEEIKVYFASAAINDKLDIADVISAEIEADKYVIIDASRALAGDDADNYVIGDFGTGIYNYSAKRTIYPNQINAPIKGVGNVTLTNKRGLTDHTKAGLIPVNSTLVVERIEPNSAGFRDIQEHISSFLSRKNVFAAGYKLKMLNENGMEIKISNELYLSMPSESELINVLSLSGSQAKAINYSKDGGYIVVDLSEIEEDISYFCLIQNRALLKTWQIVLIVVLSVVTTAGIGVAVFFIVRRRRLRNEKYDVI